MNSFDDPHGQSLPVRIPGKSVAGKWFFLAAFTFACVLFWWLPSILFRAVVHQPDSVETGTIEISIAALVLFVTGYLVPLPGGSGVSFQGGRDQLSSLFDACENFAYRCTVILSAPALCAGVMIFYSRLGVDYGAAGQVPRPFQAVLYVHMFFAFMCLGASSPKRQGWRHAITAAVLVTVPRLFFSLRGGRFVLAQAVVPIVLIAICRGWIRPSFKRVFQFALMGIVIIFVPALTRGDSFLGQQEIIQFFAAGSSLHLYQDNRDLNVAGLCPPLIVALTAKTIPYSAMGICTTDMAGLRDLPLTLDRILTLNDPSSFEGSVSGTGSNYLLDLELFGGMFAVFVGSAAFGFTCRRFITWISRPSLFAGIWAECLSRALMAPRGSLGYVFEKIPPLFLATVAVIALVWAGRFIAREGSTRELQAG